MKIAKKLAHFSAERLKRDKTLAVLLTLYIAFTVCASIICFCQGRERNGLLPLAYAALLLLATLLAECYGGIRCGKLFLSVMYFIAVGGILGTCFEFYSMIPAFDTLLHTVSGFIFAALGYVIAQKLTKGSSPIMSLLFALCFSLAVALMWELFEWGLTLLMRGDMLEDTFVYEIRSYLLSGSHNEAVELLDIEKTQIYHSGGVYEIEGYLDLGGIDTLTDMLVCFVGDIIFALVALVGKITHRDLLKYFVPACVGVE